MDAAHAQAIESRRENRERREAWKRQQEQEREQDRALIIPVLRRIIADPDATPAQQLEAIDRLSAIKGYPQSTKPLDCDRLTREFSAELLAQLGK